MFLKIKSFSWRLMESWRFLNFLFVEMQFFLFALRKSWIYIKILVKSSFPPWCEVYANSNYLHFLQIVLESLKVQFSSV